MVVTGHPETKELKAMLPDILKQMGPQQLGFLKDMLTGVGEHMKEAKAEDEDDVPELVGTNFEEASKQD
jgi:hypothetical protein